MKLSDGIKEAINELGVEILLSERLVNALADYNAFDVKSSRTVLTAMIRNHLVDRLYARSLITETVEDLYLRSMVQEVTLLGFRQSAAQYVIYSIAKALGWVDEVPEVNVEQIQEPVAVVEFEVNGVTFAMCEVAGGQFSMGGTPEQGLYAAFDERPAVAVGIDDFFIGQTPVTQRLWRAVMDNNPSHFVGDKLPVERVTWDECRDFIERLNTLTDRHFRLPTEAEWEYAARGGRNSCDMLYAGADADFLDDFVWHKGNSGNMSHEVMLKQSNELGLYDMSGNVGEWCSDWYFNSYAPSAGTVNPKGPASGITRVVRGGSWNDKAINCRVSRRNSQSPGLRNKLVGFRLAMDAI